MKTSRREFIKKSGNALAAASMISTLPVKLMAGETKSKTHPFGFQVWTVREELNKDFAGTLQKIAGMGYREVEMCSPLGYSNAGFEPLNHMSGSEMKKIIDDAGLKCTSSHFNMGELRENLDNRIEWAQGIEMKQMIAASFWLPEHSSADDYRRAADELNEIGRKTKEAGIQMGFHNHHMEFEKPGGELIYDALLDEFDPELVKMQFQVAVINIGYKAADYFRKYPGRFISAHLSDWSDKEEKQVPVGQGVVDWKELFAAAKTGGVQNFFVEMNQDTFPASADFLKKHLK